MLHCSSVHALRHLVEHACATRCHASSSGLDRYFVVLRFYVFAMMVHLFGLV